MLMKRTLLFGLVFTLLTFTLVGHSNQKKVALVKMKRGKAQVTTPEGTKKDLKKGDWIVEGSTVVTQKKSFVRLSFVDKSSMNIGPGSEMKIEKFSKSEAGVINVLSGKIRSQVTKNYLNMDKDKSKLFVKSKSAVMGIRGTDFAFTTSKKTGASTAVLFEGSVVFNKLKKGQNQKNLEAIVNKGVRIKPGQFSVASKKFKKPTIPAKMNSTQFKKLERNANFVADANGGEKKKRKSLVPPGLSGEAVKSNAEGLRGVAGGSNDGEKKKSFDMKNVMGFNDGENVKPADGSMVHIESGTVIPLPADAVFDDNAGEFVSTSVGGADSNGEYQPPADLKITDKGEMFKVTEGGAEVKIEVEIRPPNEMPATLQEIEAGVNKKKKKKGPSPAGGPDPNGPAGGQVQCQQPPCAAPIPVFNGGGASGPAVDQGNFQKSRTKVRINVQKVNGGT
jgi:hypothetical protein